MMCRSSVWLGRTKVRLFNRQAEQMKFSETPANAGDLGYELRGKLSSLGRGWGTDVGWGAWKTRPPRFPLLDLQRQYKKLRTRLLEAVTAALDSGQWILGAATAEFERAAAAACGAKYPWRAPAGRMRCGWGWRRRVCSRGIACSDDTVQLLRHGELDTARGSGAGVCGYWTR